MEKARECKRRARGMAVIWLMCLAALGMLLGGCGQQAPEEIGGVRRTIRRNGDGRILLTLDTLYGAENDELRRVVSNYNRQSKEYYVQINNIGAGTEDYEEAEERWKIDLMLGKGGDILDMSGLDKRVLGTAGVLENLYEFRIKEQWQQEFVPNIVEAAESDGALYAMGPGFNIYTVVANGALVDPEGGWTMGELMDDFAKNNKGAEAFWGISGGAGELYTEARYTFELSCFAMDDYIDWKERKADFKTEEFYRFLEFAKEKENAVAEEYVPSSAIAQGECLACFEIFNSVADYQIVRELFQGNPAVKGFPTAKGRGVSAQIFADMGIYAGSPCQEGAWDFLRYYLANYEIREVFPMDREKLEQKLADAMVSDVEYAVDSGLMEEMPKGIYWDKDDGFSVFAATQEDVEAVRELIAAVDRESHHNLTVQLIICEEMESCIKGNMPVKKAAANIDNRVNLYLKEQRSVTLTVPQGVEAPIDSGEKGQNGSAQSGGGENGVYIWDGGEVPVNSVEDFYMSEQSYYPHITADYLYAIPWEEESGSGQGEMGAAYTYYIYRQTLRTGEFIRNPIAQSMSRGIDGLGPADGNSLFYLVSDEAGDFQYLVRGDISGGIEDNPLPDKVNARRDAEGNFANWDDIKIYEEAGEIYLLYHSVAPETSDENGTIAYVEISAIRELRDGRPTEKCLQVKNSSAYGNEKFLGLTVRTDGFYTLLQKDGEGVLCLERRDLDNWAVMEIVAELEIEEYGNCAFATDEAGNIYVSDEKNLYRLKEDTMTFVPILAWQNVGVPGARIREFAVMDEDSFAVLWESDSRAWVYAVTVIN